jgi:CDP-diacylglycerol---serine O-phosphatidyltransferase
VVLKDFPPKFEMWGWVISFVYLLCGAVRLARFNCIAAANVKAASNDFYGIPIPAAAGFISSLTLFMMWLEEKERPIGPWKYLLPPLMILLAIMMVSTVRYPSFKGLNVRTKRTLPWFIGAVVLLILMVPFPKVMPFVIFMTYFIYAPLRPYISSQWRRELEEEDELEDVEDETTDSGPKSPTI